MNRQLHRSISDKEMATYLRDGIVCLRGFFDVDWVEYLREQADTEVTELEDDLVILLVSETCLLTILTSLARVSLMDFEVLNQN
mgnify:CR=1 FL=1